MKEGFDMKPIIKKMLAGILALTMVLGAPVGTSAEVGDYKGSKTVTEPDGSYTRYYNVAVYEAEPQYARLENTLGIRKRPYTSGSITVSVTETKSATVSSTVHSSYKGMFLEIGGSFGYAYTSSKTIASGTTIHLEANAPEGVYYAYVCFPCYEVRYEVEKCISSSYSGWTTLYETTVRQTPRVNAAYLDLIME